ncbi:uncharacterized protein LOC134822900 [Bolinopsis microptera]|uniref:uncharacterized protein LOC134822900 n=1 Tax=Bolinopsis microptera TaxID=2820187 RepID=UPI00307AAD69
MDTDRITTKAKVEYRIKKIEIEGKEVIDTIIITYDDDSIWSYGLGGRKSHQKTIIFSGTEYLVRVTHETLVNRRWAGAALELETNRGRVFSFEPVCSSTPKHKRTTITAEPGMEILSLQIRSGALVGYEQQPCREESVAVEEWYSVLYQGTKEDGVEVKEFSEKQEAVRWWQGIRDKCRQKSGRGALFLDTKRNTILNKTGSEVIGVTKSSPNLHVVWPGWH